MTNKSNINMEYQNQIATIAESVMERIEENAKDDPDRELDLLLDEIIQEKIDCASICYVDQAYYIAKYHLTIGFPKDGIVRWDSVWEMVFDDVYREVDYLLKKRER